MNKKVLWPFALTTLAIMLNGCGGGSSNISEDPNSGTNNGNLSSGSCTPTTSDIGAEDATCLQFALDYPIAGINFDCSSATNFHYATKLTGNAVIGSCKVGDTARFYVQSKDNKKVFLGNVNLDTIGKFTAVNGKSKETNPIYLRVLDLASGITGKTPATLDKNDETIKVAIALIKIFQSIGVENGDNLIGDIQPTQLTDTKKDQLTKISQSITATELKNGAYASILKPWLDVGQISDDEAYKLVVQTTNLSNAGVFQSLNLFSSSSPILQNYQVFRGCNRNTQEECFNNTTNLRHSSDEFYLLSDRQGYTLGYGLQWKGNAIVINNEVQNPYLLTSKVKPAKLNVNAQNAWLNPISREIQPTTPLRLSASDNPNEDLQIYQGKFFNDYGVAGTEPFYKYLTKLSTGKPQHYGLWRQNVDGDSYNGILSIVKSSPISYLERTVFKTSGSVKLGETYIFPLHATLTFNFSDKTIQPVNLGIVIDENGDIRTDIKPNSTTNDMSGQCATVADTSLVDSNGVQQYRIGTTTATVDDPSNSQQSVYVRMILSNPKFENIDGVMVGLTFVGPSPGPAKINLFNLLANKVDSTSIDFDTDTAWYNQHAAAQASYNKRENVPPPTTQDKALAQRITGTVTIKLADQSIPACKAIKTKS
ncbi:putative pilus system protein FilF [Acinetobacter calcoaceticus]|uniref:putative pilus system protein FilF n=1 Tax=Acinetobacter calcoaceticus TaxID=471 RepID=UPI000FD7CF3C|nr:protein FilF [Acinetobacter calcoaceticus]